MKLGRVLSLISMILVASLICGGCSTLMGRRGTVSPVGKVLVPVRPKTGPIKPTKAIRPKRDVIRFKYGGWAFDKKAVKKLLRDKGLDDYFIEGVLGQIERHNKKVDEWKEHYGER